MQTITLRSTQANIQSFISPWALYAASLVRYWLGFVVLVRDSDLAKIALFISWCTTNPASVTSLKTSSKRSTCNRVSIVTIDTFSVLGITATVTFGTSLSSRSVKSKMGNVECTPPVTAQTKSFIGMPALMSARVVPLMHVWRRPPSCCSTCMKMSIWDLGYKFVCTTGSKVHLIVAANSKIRLDHESKWGPF